LQTLANARTFYIVHAMMAFAAAGRTGAATRLFKALPHVEARGSRRSLPEEALAQPFCTALLALARDDYAACAELLLCVREIARRCGGSLTQRDLIHLTITEAALRARKAALARSLVEERAARKPKSHLNRLLQHRLEAMPAIG
jgi:hypothetical protein